MLKKLLYFLCVAGLSLRLEGCNQSKKKVKIGISFGVEQATRWVQEKDYMKKGKRTWRSH